MKSMSQDDGYEISTSDNLDCSSDQYEQASYIKEAVEHVTSKRLETGRYVSATSDQKSVEWRVTTLGIQNPHKSSTS